MRQGQGVPQGLLLQTVPQYVPHMTSEACEKKCCKTCFKDKKSTRSPGRSASRARRTKVADLKSREVMTLWSANRPHRPHRASSPSGGCRSSLFTYRNRLGVDVDYCMREETEREKFPPLIYLGT